MKQTYIVCYAIDTGELIEKRFFYNAWDGIKPVLDKVSEIVRENGTILWENYDLDDGITCEESLHQFAGIINDLSRLEIMEAVHRVECKPRGNRMRFSPSLGICIAAPVYGDF